MIPSFLVSFIAVFFAYLPNCQFVKYRDIGLKISFLVLTIFLAIRFNWGNDYPVYLNRFEYYALQQDFSIDTLLSLILEGDEFGWIILNWIFVPFGFFGLIIFLTCFENYVIYKFIKQNVEKKWYWLSVYIFSFSSTYMLTCSSMMRQYLAMTLFLLSLKYLVRGNFVKYTLMIFLAASFHTSALILLPIYFFRYFYFQITFKYWWIVLIFYFIWFFTASYLLKDFSALLISLEDFEKYNSYMGEDSSIKVGLGPIYMAFMFVFFICSSSLLLERKFRILIYITLFSYLFNPLVSITPTIGRLAMYFSYLSIFMYPLVISRVANVQIKYLLVIIIVMFNMKFWLDFFASPVWHDGFINYKTIFSAPSWM